MDNVRTPSLWILLKEATGSPYTTMSLNYLALLYQDQGKYEQAEPLYKQVLAHREKLLDSDHPTTLRTRKHLNELQQALKQQEASKNPCIPEENTFDIESVFMAMLTQRFFGSCPLPE
ncbi:tetratricopeptide repeat protein [Ktedonobacteria bacterium brp13]|nr:tetratricopeptide repeat protein [Ktedonobacteria bacterium brp13]